MQLTKVVIASALVLAVCAEGLPEGKDCLLKYISNVKLPQTVVYYTKFVCSTIHYMLCADYVVISKLTSCDI